jgi:hypothetical protein
MRHSAPSTEAWEDTHTGESEERGQGRGSGREERRDVLLLRLMEAILSSANLFSSLSSPQ